MKAIKHHTLFRRILLIAVLLSGIIFIPSCSRKIAFETSPVVPAAKGKVKIKKDKNSNYNIQLSVIRLAKPERLQPPKDMYVVWMESENGTVRNIGRLKTSSGLFSKTLKSSLKTVTSFKPTGFFITAENNGETQFPNGQIVIRTSSF